MISVTEQAAAHIQRLAGAREPRQRVRVIGGGCSGMQYDLQLAPEPVDGDAVVEAHGAIVSVDPRSAPLLEEVTLDYIDPLTGGLTRSGLVLNNPKAEATCGCGESFAI
jgi:iron-sulfur cluster assembly accessory protein